MTDVGTLPDRARTVRRWLARWMAFQALLAIGSRIAAHWLDRGDDSAANIRRVRALGRVQLRPGSPTLARVELDLLMAGGELDLTATPPLPGGVEVTTRVVMSGVAIRVPRNWRVWWEFSGIGGLDAGPGVQRTDEWVEADLRLHARAVMGGIGIETPQD